MSKIFFEQLKIPKPDVNLGVGSGSHALQTAQVMIEFEPVVQKYDPDWVIVVGDVNSTLACTIVCSKLGIKVAHVEAGLRSFDRTMPEEINRVLTDQISDLLFTPSENADKNLLAEGISKDKIHFVGNVMVDTLIHLLPEAEKTPIFSKLNLCCGNDKKVEGSNRERFILVTLHRPSNVDDIDKLGNIIRALEELSKDTLVLFPVHPRTSARIKQLKIDSLNSNLRLIDPIGYLEFLHLMKHAGLVITDSGGIQEETTYLGVPCLTVRPNTERPVTIDMGTNRMVSSNRYELVKAANEALNSSKINSRIPPLWDGNTAKRIIDQIYF